MDFSNNRHEKYPFYFILFYFVSKFSSTSAEYYIDSSFWLDTQEADVMTQQDFSFSAGLQTVQT